MTVGQIRDFVVSGIEKSEGEPYESPKHEMLGCLVRLT
jgi:hypothetical protein